MCLADMDGSRDMANIEYNCEYKAMDVDDIDEWGILIRTMTKKRMTLVSIFSNRVMTNSNTPNIDGPAFTVGDGGMDCVLSS